MGMTTHAMHPGAHSMRRYFKRLHRQRRYEAALFTTSTSNDGGGEGGGGAAGRDGGRDKQ